MQVDFEGFLKKVETSDALCLATSSGDAVSARPVGCVCDGDKLVVRTDDDSLKALQMQANPNVAFCLENYYGRGKAEAVGHCTDLENGEILRLRALYARRWPEVFSEDDTYLTGKEIFVSITVTHLSQWVYEGGAPLGLAHAVYG